MYRDTEFVRLYSGTNNVLGYVNEGAKNLSSSASIVI